MTTPAQWVAGARVRTLPAALSPVLAGSGAAAAVDAFAAGRAALALIVALALQVGVNYANDYSDGIRGTDAGRVGPMRLVGSGTASAGAVKKAALLSFAVAGVAGLALVALTGQWWLLAIGAACIVAAWYYTGGSSPYGYRGLGEVSVFVFFGLVATIGTAYVQIGEVTATAVLLGIAMGCFACAILVVNNLRDIPTDVKAGKTTLAVRLGDPMTRRLFVLLLVLPYVLATGIAATDYPRAVWAWLSVPLAWRACQPVLAGALGPRLVPSIRETASTQLVYSVIMVFVLTLAGMAN